MNEPLSPAAAAVLDAFTDSDTIHGLHLMTPRLAAALVAAADQVVPDKYPEARDDYDEGFLVAHLQHRGELLAIAAELETHD